MKLRTLHKEDTEYSADSVEWCTEDEAHEGYFACGTYQLVEGDDAETQRTRKGRIYLYDFDRHSGTLERRQCIETAAILDMKWLPATGHSGPQLATVNALGELEIYELMEGLEKRKLKRHTCLALENSNPSATPALALSLDWQRRGDVIQLLVSDSLGYLHQLQYPTDAHGALVKLQTWHAHGFEAWTCAYDRWTDQRVYSGGDDSLLIAWDLRSESPQRIWTNRAHGAGVTSLLSHPLNEHQLLTGSYDELLRLFDTRNMKRTLAEINLNGGIWRLKSHSQRQNLILAACMYKNFSIVDLSIDEAGAGFSLLGTYDEHSSICYGADWSPVIDNLSNSDGARKLLHMATCSFYDHKLCVSSIETNFET